jgi:hypothetical protein
MPCFGPLTAYYAKDLNAATGKRSLRFKKDGETLSGVGIKLPCGRCVGCKLERSRQWAVRCMHEKNLHDKSCFLTLTYKDEYLPPGGTLVLRHLQLFMKRLRKALGDGIRFYACGEYGDHNARPHYHLLLFNVDFPDKVFHSCRGENDYFTSALVSKLWPFGHNLLGEVTKESAAYVARYVLKKISGAPAAGHYAVIDAHGEVYDRVPEFTVMSRRPGLGTGYYEKYADEVYAHDSIVVSGREVRPPKFYDDRFEKACNRKYERIKLARRKKALAAKADNTHKRLLVKEKIVIKALKELERKL